MNEPLISVVVPVYNSEKLAGRCLDSLLTQTYPQLEIIAVNDGSDDGTGVVLADYAQRYPQIRAVSAPHGGVTTARFRGIREARGQWIGFMDADDESAPELYGRLLENALEHNAQISHCGYRMVYPSGKWEDHYGTGTKRISTGAEGCRELLEGTRVEPGLWNKLYRRELFDGLDMLIDPGIRVREDLLMNFYLFRQAERTVYEDICLYCYLLRPGSASQSTHRDHHLTDPLRVLHILLEETRGDWELHTPVYRRLIWTLIHTAGLPGHLLSVREARAELRRRLWAALTGTACSGKLKLMALWSAIWPRSFGMAHQLYSHVTGLDKKYKA